ncbi:MAG: NAD(P) transhydrogenase subunit alpha part 2 [Pirellulaceae bacterium]
MMPSITTCRWLLVWAVLAAPAAAQSETAESKPAPAPALQTQSAEPLSPSASPLAQIASDDNKTVAETLPHGAASPQGAAGTSSAGAHSTTDFMAMVFVFMLATFIGIGVIRRVSRLLHTPLMSLTNAISAISVVGAIIVTGGEHYPTSIRVLGAVALFASMTNIISGFLITDRMLKMFKTREGGKS